MERKMAEASFRCLTYEALWRLCRPNVKFHLISFIFKDDDRDDVYRPAYLFPKDKDLSWICTTQNFTGKKLKEGRNAGNSNNGV